jgi:hypothetical protein
VLVVDFDEFLYCPAASPTADAQSKYFQTLVSTYVSRGVDQLSFKQWVTYNRTSAIVDCMAAMLAAGSSIFNCFASYSHYVGGHSFKSLHLTHRCPLTGYHQACPVPNLPRTYNCVCNAVEVPASRCVVIHLTTQQSFYDKAMVKVKEAGEYNETAMNEARLSISELLLVANYSNQRPVRSHG